MRYILLVVPTSFAAPTTNTSSPLSGVQDYGCDTKAEVKQISPDPKSSNTIGDCKSHKAESRFIPFLLAGAKMIGKEVLKTVATDALGSILGGGEDTSATNNAAKNDDNYISRDYGSDDYARDSYVRSDYGANLYGSREYRANSYQRNDFGDDYYHGDYNSPRRSASNARGSIFGGESRGSGSIFGGGFLGRGSTFGGGSLGRASIFDGRSLGTG